MSRSLCTWRAETTFFLPDCRVIGLVAAGFGVGVALFRVAELGERPGAEYDAEAGLAEVYLSVRVLGKICVYLFLHRRDLAVEHGQNGHLSTHDAPRRPSPRPWVGPDTRRAAPQRSPVPWRLGRGGGPS